ncbi:MAG: hypothetical protein HY716_02095 [Planctomycetes bacterium]|nr:hypothetical protein [Planctomycetota bacterium]
MRKTIFTVWWAANGLLLVAIAAVGLRIASASEGSNLYAGLTPPDSLPAVKSSAKREALGTEMLRDLPNPLRLDKSGGSGGATAGGRSDLARIALLHGIDQLAGDLNSATAYLYLPSRKIQANAYFGEDIRDSATGEGIPELAGWKLAGLIPGGAVFRNGKAEETLRIGESPWSGGGGIAGGPGAGSTDVGLAPQVVRQWAFSAKASSEYSPDGWSAQQTCGPPNTEQAGDRQTAWTTKQQNDGEEWIELTYSLAVIPVGVRIHETCGPGAVIRVEAINAGGAWQVLWQGSDPTKGQQIAWFGVPFDPPQFSTRSIKITLDTRLVQGWNQIDAVELVGKTAQESAVSETKKSEPQLPFPNRERARTARRRRGR